ncbi:UMP-CMP KINASE [Salix koriyanagi]|uniref:adenylate kinase n=1 Tax=Salix koriyanagi TaxID=2511006 RepID=A0A9Q0Z5X9_9ROSI|nr:UMP-CMP KINASE [Salix koriyanagi]
MIQDMIKEGKIVPSEVTIKLLQKAMQDSGNDKFLIDGFPRNEENRAAFEAVTKIEPAFVLFFDCSEEEMEKRILSRNQGREDDNIETIRKRFKGKVQKVDATKSVDEVFEVVKVIFTPKDEKKEDLLCKFEYRKDHLNATNACCNSTVSDPPGCCLGFSIVPDISNLI